MRIIAGSRRGRKLLSPLNEGRDTKTGDVHATRPTLDRVKEAMFNIIQNRIWKRTVLDLFAGTGSLGLEAASRGASSVILVDYFKETFDLLKKNISNLEFQDICRPIFSDYMAALEKFSKDRKVFDIIFIDPPYLNEMIQPAMDFIEKNSMLSEDGIIVTKYDVNERVVEGSGSIVKVLQRKYGNTVIAIYQHEE